MSPVRRVKVQGDLYHGQVPDDAVYVGRQARGLRRSPYARVLTEAQAREAINAPTQ